MNPPDLKDLSRGVSSDMSPEAIARRLEIAGELYELGKVLGSAESAPLDQPESNETETDGRRRLLRHQTLQSDVTN